MPTADCDRVLEVLGEEKLPAELEAHLATCEFCRGGRAAYEAMTPGAPASIDPAKVEAIRARALGELARRPKATPWWMEAAALAVVNFAVAAIGLLALSVHRQPEASLELS